VSVQTVLEYGCGDGENTVALAARDHADRWLRWDAALLRRVPALGHYAGVRVVVMVK
jgi:hypothetical protein